MILMFDIVLKTNKTSPSKPCVFPSPTLKWRDKVWITGSKDLDITLAHLLRCLVPRVLGLDDLLRVRVLDPPVDGEAQHPRVPEGGAVELRELGPVLSKLGPGGVRQDQGVNPHSVPRGLEKSDEC